MRFSKLLIAAVVAVAGIAITAEDASANCYGQQVVIQQRQRLRVRGALRSRLSLRHSQQIVAPVYAQQVVAVQKVVQPVYVQPVQIQAYVAQPVAIVEPQCSAAVCGQLQSYQSVLPQCH